MFGGFNKALKTGKPDIQPKNWLVSISLEAIYRSITPARSEIFTCLIEKKPHNLTELVQLVKRDYANVWKDVQALQGLEIIKLKKVGKEIRPMALYEKITFDFSALRKIINPPIPYFPIFHQSHFGGSDWKLLPCRFNSFSTTFCNSPNSTSLGLVKTLELSHFFPSILMSSN